MKIKVNKLLNRADKNRLMVAVRSALTKDELNQINVEAYTRKGSASDLCVEICKVDTSFANFRTQLISKGIKLIDHIRTKIRSHLENRDNL